MKVKNETIRLYKPADTYFIVNDDDPDLTPIRLSLPQPPDATLIDGYGLHPDEQCFAYMDVPKRLRIIEKEVADKLRDAYSRNTNNTITIEKAVETFWSIFEERRDELQQEEEYIKNIHWYRTYGYWFYNDGKPTYMPPDYFDFLNFWRMQDVPQNGGRPEYRDDDRIKYLYWHYLETCTETFSDLDKQGKAIRVDGVYNTQDVGGRVFYGGVEPKYRRRGATHQACHKIKKGVESMFGGYGTIISMDGDNAVVHFTKKLLPALNEYPMFLKPRWDGNNTSKNIKYRTRNNDYLNPCLNGLIDYTESAGEMKNDGDKLHYYLSDEEGKASKSSGDILERWNVNKLAQSTGGGSSIVGFCLHPSTVEMMNEGGTAYRKLTELSDFYRRIPGKGQTLSGLGLIFFPAHRGLENFIDKFGMSVVEKPTKRQIELSPDAKFARLKMGAHEYLMKERTALLAEGSPRALETYRSIRRKMPMCFAECWIGTSGDMGFNLEKIDQRLMELDRKSKMIKGNFQWEQNIPDTRVIFVPNENGRWEVSLTLDSSQTNLKKKVQVYNARTNMWEWQWQGLHFNEFTLGADPFEYTNKAESKQRDDSSRQSNGGFGVLRSRSLEVDKSDDPSEWTTRRFVCSYSYRPPSTYEFNEDVIMTCVYYGCSVYMERNKTSLWQGLVERGYGGFLQFDVNLSTGKPNDKPGSYAGEDTKNELFSETKDYVNYHCHIEEHSSYLKEVKNIRGREEMTKYDRFTGHGWALVGDKRKSGGLYSKKQEKQSNNASVSGVLKAIMGRS